MRLLLNEADVSDCFQETFVSALEYSKRNDIANWPGLLARIATTRALDQLRRRATERSSGKQSLPEDICWRGASPLEEVEAIELSDRLRIALAQLPETQSQAFCLRHLSGLDYADVANEMQITVSAASALIHRARNRLEQLLLGAATPQSERT
jgi:RNA polymerase sigma-70 factor, ECF subfamily